MSRVECVYETQKGWNVTTEAIRDYNLMPKEARDYVELIEKFTNVYGEDILGNLRRNFKNTISVRYIGVGQDRLALIDRGPLNA